MGRRDLQKISDREWYYGDLADNGEVQDGTGIKRERDGSLYYGGWKSGLRDGYGMLGEADGSLKVGFWSADKFTGGTIRIWPPSDQLRLFFGKSEGVNPQEGTLLCSDGRLYHGVFSDWRKGDFNGEGTIVWPNKRIYAGRWKNRGTDIGGIIRRPDKTDGKLIGTLSNVRKGYVGKSWPQESDKQFFYGLTEDDEIRNANGILFYQGGEFFAGKMAGGQRDGLGLLYTAEGIFLYGDWENGYLNGNGTYVKIAEDFMICYIGGFKDSLFDGEGCVFERSGTDWNYNYAGGWKRGKKSGDGLLNIGKDQFFIGRFYEDEKDGLGETVLQDGSRSSVQWKKGVPAVLLDSVNSSGPSRTMYRSTDEIDGVVLNSLESFPDVNEAEFVGIRADAGSEYKREMFIEPGCDYEVRIFYHNDANEGGPESKETRVRAFYSKSIDAGHEGVVSASFVSENATTPLIWDGIRLISSESLPISYKIASAKIQNSWKSNGHILPQTFFSDDGIYIGADELNGILPANDQGQITFIIHAGGKKKEDSISFSARDKANKAATNAAKIADSKTIQTASADLAGKKRKRSRVSVHVTGSVGNGDYEKHVRGDIGEEINVKIYFTNSASQQDIKISIDIPAVCEYVSGSGYLKLSDGSRRKQEDAWIHSGIVLNRFVGDGEGEIQFRLRYFPVTDNANFANKLSAMIETTDISMRGELKIESV